MPPRGGQRQAYLTRYAAMNVSSHAPARGATSSFHFDTTEMQCFKSCPREGGNMGYAENAYKTAVSSHAPARGATYPSWEFHQLMVEFQVMPPRGGQPAHGSGSLLRHSVSSHAPARGATDFEIITRRFPEVSSHAPARGATKKLALLDEVVKFQVMPPRGGQRCMIW